MKKLLLLLLLTTYILFITPARAQTNVSGTISNNTTWNIAGSPYIVVGSLNVQNGYTLTIEPGVTVKFDTATMLRISGELIANGTASNHILFTANSTNPSMGYWKCVQFMISSTDAVYDASGNYLSGSILRYCDVFYGGGGADGAVNAVYAEPYIVNCHVAYSSTDGINVDDAIVNIDSCVVENNLDNGIEVFGALTTNCNWHINNNTAVNNMGGGMYIRSGSCQSGTLTLTVARNSIKSNRGRGGLYVMGPFVIVSENDFQYNTNDLSTLGSAMQIEKTPYIIECNLVHDNYTQANDAIVYIETVQPGSNIIRYNTFERNIDSSSNSLMSMLFIRAMEEFPIYVNHNIFSNNNFPANDVCRLIGSVTGTNTTTFYLDSNQFNDNPCINDVKVEFPIAPVNGLIALITHNNFVDQVSQYAIYNAEPYGGTPLYADSNYWNSTSFQHVDSVIYDYYDGFTQSHVLYSTILNGPVKMLEVCIPDISTGAEQIENPFKGFIIYPNPAHNIFTIHFEESGNRNWELGIFDIAGRCVYTDKIVIRNSYIVNENFSPGVYFVKVSDGERSVTEKLIVQ
jgi:hypothetical protein